MILIKNAKVVDGTGAPSYQADVLISGDKISAIGHFQNKQTETIIDGLGMYLTPGFIDIHTRADHTLSLFTNPAQEEYRTQGVTTIIGGNDGVSLAPLIYGSLKALRKWTDTNTINVNWHTFDEFAAVADRLRLHSNFATLVGHSTIRRDIAPSGNDLTDNELRVLTAAVVETLRDGALGVSINLASAHGKKISHHEITTIAETVNEDNGVLVINPRSRTTHLVDAVNEIAALYAATGATTIIHYFEPVPGYEKEYAVARDIVRKTGDRLYTSSLFTSAVPTPLYHVLPQWAQHNTIDDMAAYSNNPVNEKQIIKELLKIKDATIINAPREYHFLIGQTLKEFGANRNIRNSANALYLLMRLTKMRGVLAVPTPPQELTNIIHDDRTLIAGSIALFFKSADKARWPIEKMVSRVTRMPARAYNLPHRGIIKESCYADVVLMNDKREIAHVIVNGKIKTGAGRFIRKTP